MLFYINYGCTECTEQLIVSANSLQEAENYARIEAEDTYYSYDCNYLDRYEYEELTDDEFADMEFEYMNSDIFYFAEKYDKNNPIHIDVFEEQKGIPFEI